MSEPRALGRYFYGDRLPGQARRFYDVLDSRLAGGDYRAEVPLTLEERDRADRDAFAACKALRHDRPEYFFLGRKMTFFYCSGREGRLRMQILYTPAEIETLKTTFRQKMLPLMAGTADKSLVQREELIYSRLARQLRYQNTRSEQEHNLVGPMLASRGVCEGQNALLLYCLRRAGVTCVQVLGKGRTENHCWAMVWLNGEPVHCDVTWEKPGKGVMLYRYFNLTDEQIARDHSGFAGQNLPACCTETYSYYRLHGHSVCSLAELAGHLRSGAQRGGMAYGQLQPPCTDAQMSRAVNAALRGLPGCWNIYHVASLGAVALMKQAGR
ncbi:MAG: transglutaminase domain-containing protein [Oscillospiraceae bacterium]|nr:transglutaminase domain-containing protein [Oscillospiraceae bacterium]